MLTQIASTLHTIAGNNPYHFDTPLNVPATGGAYLHLWAVCTAPNGDVYVMDVDEEWHKLEDRPQDAAVIAAVQKRVNAIAKQYQSKRRATV